MNEMDIMTVEIAKLTLAHGDVVVVKCDEPVPDDMARRMRETIGRCVPEGVKVLVLDDSLDLMVLTRAEIDARAA